jgi:predicted transcriptional regulator/transcriptional regulator with XRE-family HTH domain
MTGTRKLFVGPRLRRLREQRGWNQLLLAQHLALSLSYVSQIENNQRPVTAGVLLKLAEIFGGDVGQFSDDHDKRQLAELDCALHDRSLGAAPASPALLARMIEQAPELVDAFLTLYQRHGRLQEEYAQTVERFYGDQGGEERREALSPLPYEEVRDYLNRRNNYLDRLDRLAEDFAGTLRLQPGQCAPQLQAALRQHCRVEAVFDHADPQLLRRYDPLQRRLHIAAGLSDAQRAFQLATQYALLAHADAIEQEVQEGGFVSGDSRALARQGLAHYFAAAVLMPYQAFLSSAQACRYDIELLQQQFHVSFETVCHRLSTLQRPGARGVPFYFVRLDQAGNISKRQSATTFHFARHGGACPLWHVHEAFAQPGRILSQVAEMPDGTRFFGIARTIERGAGGFKTRRKSFAIGLGCELSRAAELVYAEGLGAGQPRDVVPIGPGCRMCPRDNCVQRAFPPTGKTLRVDSDAESLISYRF